MCLQSGLRGFVVIGRHHQGCAGTRLFGRCDQAYGFGCIVGAGTGDHRNPSGRLCDHNFHNHVMLFMSQSGAFAGCTHWHQPMAALVNVPIDQLLERIDIHFAVCKRRDKCRQRSCNHCASFHLGRKCPGSRRRTLACRIGFAKICD